MISAVQPFANSMLHYSMELVRRHGDHGHSHNHGAEEGENAEMGCSSGNEYQDGRMGARISSIFVILVASTAGAFFPIISARWSKLNIHPGFFFVAKFFGSGVIIATALIHLLQHANISLSAECLGKSWAAYPYAYGICLIALFGTFLVELLSKDYLEKRGISHAHSHGTPGQVAAASGGVVREDVDDNSELADSINKDKALYSDSESIQSKELAMQLGSIFILEFGVIFHSVFVGLALAVSGEEFVSLYIVLVFHQMFEGLGLGARIAMAPWPSKKQYIPWLLALIYGLTTPIAIAIGLGVRESYPPGSYRALVTTGIFDSISAGILLYVGLVELIGGEFFGHSSFRNEPTWKVIAAFGVMCVGAGLMALLGRWA